MLHTSLLIPIAAKEFKELNSQSFENSHVLLVIGLSLPHLYTCTYVHTDMHTHTCMHTCVTQVSKHGLWPKNMRKLEGKGVDGIGTISGCFFLSPLSKIISRLLFLTSLLLSRTDTQVDFIRSYVKLFI